MRDGDLKHVFDMLERAFSALNIDYYLIGAMARQVWYDRGGLSFRTTRDVDYAALIGSVKEYRMVKDYLVEREGCVETRENAFVLLTKDGVQIDILPFGDIESDGSVEIEGTGMTSIRVDGMKEVFESGTELVITESGNSFKVATLTAIALLKFISFDDRPEVRQKDARDIANILLHFFNLHSDLIYEWHNDLFGDVERELENIGAIVLGREIKKIIAANAALSLRFKGILDVHITLAEKSPFILQVVSEIDKDVETIVQYLTDIAWGFENNSES